MYNPEIQYRCDIIRGKSTGRMDDFLPAYAQLISNLCPLDSESFKSEVRNGLAELLFNSEYNSLENKNRKTVDNHRTENAKQLLGMYYEKDGVVYESETTAKLLSDGDQPAFFKNLCLNFQFPNGTQYINTIKERVEAKISFKPFQFIVTLLDIANKVNSLITLDELYYYVLNAKQVLMGEIKPIEVFEKIKSDRDNNISKKVIEVKNHSWTFQHMKGQINLLEFSNLIRINDDFISLNYLEASTIKLFIDSLNIPLVFNLNNYDLSNREERIQMYEDWGIYFGKVKVTNYEILATSVEALQREQIPKNIVKEKKKGTDHTILGNEGEEYVFNFEKERVHSFDPKLVKFVKNRSSERGIGFDIESVEANENITDPDFARYIEVKSTLRYSSVPDLGDDSWADDINLTRKEWVAAKQWRKAYNIYRVYFTSTDTVIRKINNPFEKNENNELKILPITFRMDFSSKSIDKQY